MGITIDVKIDDREIKALFQRLQGRVKDLTPAMKVVGQIVRTSVVKNFEVGGRPQRWKPSRRAVVEGGRTMIDTGRLMKSITSRAYRDRAEVGTNVIYAAIHQFGFEGDVEVKSHIRKVKSRDIRKGRKKIASGITVVRSHSRHMNIPARPFLMVQDEDWREIREAILEYLMEVAQ